MTRSPSLPSTGLALLALSTLAIALPLFETLGEGATFFVVHNAKSIDIWAFSARIFLVPALLLSLLVAFTQLISPALGRNCAALLVGVLAALWALGFLRTLPAAGALACAIAVGLVFSWFYRRSAAFQSFLQLMGWISPLALISFLQFSAAGKLLDTTANVETGMAAPSDTPVVMLVLDELSQAAISTTDGNIDAGRLPNFARLAAMSTWYSNTTTVSSQTERAIASILSGMHTQVETAPIYTQFPQNIFTVMAASHSVHATETVSRLCPDAICQAEAQEVDRSFNRAAMYADIRIIFWHSVLPAPIAAQWLPPISSSWKGFTAATPANNAEASEEDDLHWFVAMVADMTASDQKRFASFVRSVAGAETSSFHYLHLALPHTPWIYLPDGRVYNGRFTPGQSSTSYDWQENQFLVDQGALRYSLQVEYVDELLGELLDALENHPRADDFLLIVTSDHGVAFAPGEMRRRPVASTLADVARVPLFIRYPDHEGGKQDTRRAQTIDILPTIAGTLGLPLDNPVDGSSLVSRDWSAQPRFIWEGRDSIADIEAEQDMGTAIARIQRVVREGQPTMDNLTRVSRSTRDAGVASLPTQSTGIDSTMLLKLERGEWYENIDTSSPLIPSRLTGWLQGAPEGTEIVIYLNGEAAGVGETFGTSGEISLMLDARLFRDGANDMQAFALKAEELHPITIDQSLAPWRLALNDSGKIIEVRRSNLTWQRADTSEGDIGFSKGSTALGSVGGWAYETRSKTAAKYLLLLDGDTLAATGFRAFPNAVHAKQRGLEEDLPYWFSLEIGPELKARGKALSLLALFEDGSFAQIRMK